MRNCTHGAIKIDNFVAVVDSSKCKDCSEATCLAKCPTGAIQTVLSAKAAKTA